MFRMEEFLLFSLDTFLNDRSAIHSACSDMLSCTSITVDQENRKAYSLFFFFVGRDSSTLNSSPDIRDVSGPFPMNLRETLAS